jgi:hypothetical protein
VEQNYVDLCSYHGKVVPANGIFLEDWVVGHLHTSATIVTIFYYLLAITAAYGRLTIFWFHSEQVANESNL